MALPASIIVAADGNVLGVSSPFEALTRWNAMDVCGRPLKDLFATPREGDEILDHLATSAAMDSRPFHLRGNGIGPIDVLASGIAYRGHENKTEALCIFIRQR